MLLPLIANVLGVGVSHVYERVQRTHFLTLMRLSEQLSHASLKADTQQKRLLSQVMRAQDLPSLVLQARVDLGDLQIRHTLGVGSFGRVSCALWHGQDGEPRQVAVKTLHRHRISEGMLRSTVRSMQLELSLPTHPNVVGLLGVGWSIDAARVMLVAELCAGGSLAHALESGATGEWARARKLGVASGLASGLAFLHGHAVRHRDPAPPPAGHMAHMHAHMHILYTDTCTSYAPPPPCAPPPYAHGVHTHTHRCSTATSSRRTCCSTPTSAPRLATLASRASTTPTPEG